LCVAFLDPDFSVFSVLINLFCFPNGAALREPRQRRYAAAGRSKHQAFSSGHTPSPSVMRNCPQNMSSVLDYPSYIVRSKFFLTRKIGDAEQSNTGSVFSVSPLLRMDNTNVHAKPGFGALRAPSLLSLIRGIGVIRGDASPFRAFRVFRSYIQLRV
jgi:hypothetical protein